MINATLILVLATFSSASMLDNLIFILSNSQLRPLFFQGFAEGMQEDPSQLSPCIESYSAVKESYIELQSTLSTLNVVLPFNLLDNTNGFINELVTNYVVCDYATISKNYFTDRKTALLNFLINFSGNFPEIQTSFQELEGNLNDNEVVRSGINFGEIIRYSTGISF